MRLTWSQYFSIVTAENAENAERMGLDWFLPYFLCGLWGLRG
jgi:hypothetical protein